MPNDPASKFAVQLQNKHLFAVFIKNIFCNFHLISLIPANILPGRSHSRQIFWKNWLDKFLALMQSTLDLEGEILTKKNEYCECYHNFPGIIIILLGPFADLCKDDHAKFQAV